MALMKATHANIHKTNTAIQEQQLILAANIASSNTAIQEQQLILARLIELTALYDELGVIAQCEKCQANILPLELDQCLPASHVLSFLLCPSCS